MTTPGQDKKAQAEDAIMEMADALQRIRAIAWDAMNQREREVVYRIQLAIGQLAERRMPNMLPDLQAIFIDKSEVKG
jgi:hypothetical protein